jgi:hypothetical protein
MQLRICAGLTVLMTALAPDASACSCGASGPPCQNYFQVDAVFLGTVQTISTIDVAGDPPYPRRVVRFAVTRAFKGIQGTSVEVTTGIGGGDCGFKFEKGGRYLVYARRTKDGSRLATSICSRTRPVAKADEDLRYLDDLPASGAGARVYGTITHWEHDLAEGHGVSRGPAPGVYVVLQGPGGVFTTTSDHQGGYEIGGIPPGSYELRAQPPEPFSRRDPPWELELRDPRECFQADFGVRYDGRIRGSIVAGNGGPAADMTVEVRPANLAGSSGLIPTLDVRTDAFGMFEFTDVSPGRYVVGVGFSRWWNWGTCYPRTFYPGTPDARDATVVEIGPGTHYELQPLRLPALAAHQLTGVVVHEDGTPVEGAGVVLNAGEFPRSQVANPVQTNWQGGFSFTVCEGLTYVLSASFSIDATPPLRFKAASDVFLGSSQTSPLRLVLRPIE